MNIRQIFLALFATLAAAPAFAAAPQVFVSSRGANAATCGTTVAPCRTFQYAHDVAVTAGGVISVMDSGEYGPVRITKSVSIINNGAGVATIAAGAGQDAITIYLTDPAKIVLRGLTVDGAKTADAGLVVSPLSTGALAIDISRCVFRNFIDSGIVLAGNAKTTFSISDVEASDNAQAGFAFLATETSDGTVKNSRFNRNTFGVFLDRSVITFPVGVQATFKAVDLIDNRRSVHIGGDDPNRYAATFTGVTISGSPEPLATRVASLRLSRSTWINIPGTTPLLLGSNIASAGDNQAALFDRPVVMPIIQMR